MFISHRFLFYLSMMAFLGFLLQGCNSSKQITNEPSITTEESTDTGLSDNTYRIQTGDEIEILVWEQPNFNTLTTVSGLGSIAIPLIGELEVTGLTKSELEQNLRRELSEYIKGPIELTVSIRNTERLMVSVFGMVNDPDNYPVVNQTSIFRILSTAGGPTPEANLRKVRVYRNKSNIAADTFDLTKYLESGEMNSSDIMIYPGDIIYITPKENVVREMSEFLRDVVILFGIFRVFN